MRIFEIPSETANMQQPINLSNLSAIIFDLGGVILNLDYNLTINAFKELGGAKFDELYTQANQSRIIDKYETGQISTRDFLDYMQSFLPGNTKDEAITNAWNAMLLNLPAERIDFLYQIKQKLPIFLFSNTNELHFQNFTGYIEKTFGNKGLLEDIFNQTYYSHIEGLRKPDALAFEKVIKDHKLDPATTLFIDDSIQHIEGARKVGLLTKHLIDEDIIDIFDGLKT